jgi:hypothetical protein
MGDRYPLVLVDTKTYHRPPDGLPPESSYVMGQHDVTNSDEPDPS